MVRRRVPKRWAFGSPSTAGAKRLPPLVSTIHFHVMWEITKKRLMVNLYWPSAAFVCDGDYRHKKQT